MKIKYLVILTVLLTIFIAGCTTIAKGPELKAIPETYDFGKIKAEDGVVTAEVKLKNTGSQALEILGISTSCGCTTAEADKEILLSGEVTNLKIEFDPNVHEGLTGLLKREVYIRTNNPNEPETIIRVTVTVEEDHDDLHEEDHDVELKENEISPFELHEKIEDSENIKIIDTRSAGEFSGSHIPVAVNIAYANISSESLEQLDITTNDKIIVYGKSSISGKLAYNKLQNLGYSNVKILFGGFTHWEEDSYDIVTGDKVTADESTSLDGPKISFARELHDFGQVPQLGGVVTTEFTVFNKGDSNLEINSISTSCGCTTAEIDFNIIKPGESATLKVFFDPNFHKEPDGIFKRTVFLETNDPDNLGLVTVTVVLTQQVRH